MTALYRVWLSIWLVAAAAGCSGSGESELPEGTCVNSTDCPDGFVCLQEACQQIECATSAECAMEQYCNGVFQCVDGCEADTDCKAGFECNAQSNTCEAYGCRDTQLDCGYGEFCDPTSGQCIADDAPHCQGCDYFAPNSCGNGSTCVIFDVGEDCRADGDCPDGYLCDQRLCHLDRCLANCAPASGEEQCPRGFECGDVYGDGSLNACFGDCEWMLDNGL